MVNELGECIKLDGLELRMPLSAIDKPPRAGKQASCAGRAFLPPPKIWGDAGGSTPTSQAGL
ncbi:MAG: hypothetical protein QXO15_02675 [Nitrososphaerota archaeon]